MSVVLSENSLRTGLAVAFGALGASILIQGFPSRDTFRARYGACCCAIGLLLADVEPVVVASGTAATLASIEAAASVENPKSNRTAEIVKVAATTAIFLGCVVRAFLPNKAS